MIKKSFSKLIREELVKRFENLCADQIHENNQRFEEVLKKERELYRLLQEQKANLKAAVNSINETESLIKKQNSQERDTLSEELFSQRQLVKDKLKELQAFMQASQDKLSSHPPLSYFEEMKDVFNKNFVNFVNFVKNELKDSSERNACESSSLKKEIHRVYDEGKLLHDRFLDFSEEVKHEIDLLKQEREFSKKDQNHIKSRLLVLEKKIEHIYLLMGRTSQGGEK